MKFFRPFPHPASPHRLGAFVVVAASLLLSAAGVRADDPPALGSEKSPLRWEQETVELTPGVAAYRTPTLEARFRCTNASSAPVELAALEPDCGCTTAELPAAGRVLPAGGSSEIVARFTVADRTGRQEKHIVVRTKAAGAPDSAAVAAARLTLVIQLPDLLRAEPASALTWRLGEEATPKRVILTAAFPEMPVERITVATSQGVFRPTVRVLEAGRRYELEVTPASTELSLSANVPLSCQFRGPTQDAAQPPPVRVFNVTALVQPPPVSAR